MKGVFKTLFLVMSIFLIYSCEEFETSGTVEYKVISNPSGFSITYQNGSGNTEQQDISSSHWSTSFIGNDGDFVYISAQAENTNATITTEIYYKGDLIETATSSGDYIIATSSGSLSE